MASKTLHTNQITFMDLTDDRKLDVYITSNLPTTQIKDANNNTYTPDWGSTNLVLSADIYLDSVDVTDNTNTNIIWYEQIGTGTRAQIGTGVFVTINTNKMTNSAMVTYSCEATYQNILAHSQLTFTRVDTGKNGADGTSVNIKGTATSVKEVSGTDYYTIVYSDSSITLAEEGDAYVYNGDLYVCVGAQASDGTDYFINVGRIQGPAGKDAKSIVLSGDSQVFKVSNNEVYVPDTIKVIATAFNTSITTWSYSPNGGQNWFNTLDGVERKDNVVTITGATLMTDSVVIKASDGSVEDVFTVYKAADGENGTDGRDGQSASMAFLTNENVTFAADSSGKVRAIAIPTNIVAYNGTQKTLATVRTKADGTIDIQGLPVGMSATSEVVGAQVDDIDNRELSITLNVSEGATFGSALSNNGLITIPVTSPVNTDLVLTWSKVNSGAQGSVGPKGADAYTVLLTNESHVFAGDVSNAMAGQATTQVLAYNGASPQTVTISSVDGKAAATIDTDTSIAGLKFKCSALSGTSPTITFTCTTAFKSANGTIPIVLSVGGVQITKMFTYSISFKGDTGGQGPQGSQGPTGQQGVSASLVDITPSAHYFKSTTGKDGTFTPEYIYLYPRFQTVTYGKWEYSTNGGTSWSTVNTGNNDLTIGTFNSVSNALRIKNTSSLYTDTVTSISFRCVSSNASVYDTVSIAKIYDVVDLQIGGRNLLTNSGYMTNLTGWTVYTTNYPVNDLKIEANDIYGSVLTATGTAASSRIRVGQYIPYLQKMNRVLTFSMIYQASEDATAVTAGGKYSEYDTSREYGSFSGTNVKRTDLGNGFTYMETTFNLTYTETTRSFFVYIYPGVQTTKIVYCKLEEGNKATTGWSPAPEDVKSTTFQLYAPKGYLITNDVPTITLETFAYDGGQKIINATFAWYSWNGEAWVAISGATGTSLTINRSNVFKSNVYKCDMTYGGKVYTATVTVEDKTDIYDSLIHVTSKYSPSNRLYWVLYSTVYSEEGEKDELLGPVSVTAPTSPVTGAYWYKIDETNYTVTLMKYSGTAWVATTDKQEFVYDWFMLNDTNSIVTLGERSKVKIVTSDNFSRTCSVQCNVLDQELAALTHCNQVLNDPSDPIVSETEPSNPINGQLWIKTGANGSYVLLVWDASNSKWVVSEADTQKKVYVSKPTTYNDGDIWIVAAEYEPDSYIDGVLQTEVVDGVTKVIKHLAGTMLRAQYGSDTYKDSDWVDALIYKKELDKLKENLNVYNQFFTFDNTGMTMKAKSLNGQISEFSTKLTNNELGFYQGENKVAYINNNQLNISKAEITNGMTIGGDAPMFQIGNFVIMQESNGSLSIGLKS